MRGMSYSNSGQTITFAQQSSMSGVVGTDETVSFFITASFLLVTQIFLVTGSGEIAGLAHLNHSSFSVI